MKPIEKNSLYELTEEECVNLEGGKISVFDLFVVLPSSFGMAWLLRK